MRFASNSVRSFRLFQASLRWRGVSREAAMNVGGAVPFSSAENVQHSGSPGLNVSLRSCVKTGVSASNEGLHDSGYLACTPCSSERSAESVERPGEGK